jgi:hypothetical protein
VALLEVNVLTNDDRVLLTAPQAAESLAEALALAELLVDGVLEGVGDGEDDDEHPANSEPAIIATAITQLPRPLLIPRR